MTQHSSAQLLLALALVFLQFACESDAGGEGDRRSGLGESDREIGMGDTDPDAGQLDFGAPVVCEDTDGDGISDAVEGDGDPDGDDEPNSEDLDSDGDGILDADEFSSPACASPRDTDADGTPDYLDDDSDGDGIPDAATDGSLDTDGDGLPDYRDLDDDGDGLRDVDEIGDDPDNPRDTDGDGTPDYLDTDSDGDGLPDSASAIDQDTDGDGTPDYLDDDADGDGIADTVELGDDPSMPPDTDGDGAPNYLDADSDGDGLADGSEDANGNGVVDAGESDPLSVDTDGDGTDDLVESAAGTDPGDPASNPTADGNFVFVVPYQQPPVPASATLDFTTDIVQADVMFSIDTTGSMGGELDQLRADLQATIIPALEAEIPDLGFGVSYFEDYPMVPFGGSMDLPFELITPITPDAATAQAGLMSLVIGSGGDGPESGIEALYQLATESGTSWPAADTTPAGSVAPAVVGFRPGALPIIIQMTDAPMNAADTYGANIPMAAARDQTMTALTGMGARVIAVVSSGGLDAETEYLDVVSGTGAVVPPEAFGSTGECLTGLSGAALPPNAMGECPLLFRIQSDGSGLGASVVDAVVALAKFSGLDVDAQAFDEPDNVDAQGNPVAPVAQFLDRVVPNPSPDAATLCLEGLAVADRIGSNGIEDTFLDVQPGSTVCFDVIAKQNDTVEPALAPQLFRARIDVHGDGVTLLDSRQVWFLVPPKPPEPGDPPCNGLDDDCGGGKPPGVPSID